MISLIYYNNNTQFIFVFRYDRDPTYSTSPAD